MKQRTFYIKTNCIHTDIDRRSTSKVQVHGRPSSVGYENKKFLLSGRRTDIYFEISHFFVR